MERNVANENFEDSLEASEHQNIIAEDPLLLETKAETTEFVKCEEEDEYECQEIKEEVLDSQIFVSSA